MYYKVQIFIIIIYLITACKREEIVAPIYPDNANVELTYDWSRGCCVPDEVIMILTLPSGEKKTMITSSKQEYLQLPTGKYEVLTYETTQNIVVDGDIARVTRLPDGTLANPGGFSAGTGCIMSDENEPCHCMIVMKKQFSEMNLSLDADGKHVGMLTEIEGKLSGISSARDIRNNCCVVTREGRTNSGSETGAMKFDLMQTGNSFAGNAKYLGVADGEKQILGLTMVYTDGSKQTVEIDITGKIAGESESGEIPVPDNISVQLNVEQIKGVITATVTDWKTGVGGDLDAGES